MTADQLAADQTLMDEIRKENDRALLKLSLAEADRIAQLHFDKLGLPNPFDAIDNRDSA